MRQVLFLSGKGGTGKTSLAAAFAVLAENKVLADCDVDAANLHLLLDPQVIAEGDFEGSKEAVRDASLCTQCGRCREADHRWHLWEGSPNSRIHVACI